MNSKYLLPHRFILLGWTILLPGLLMGSYFIFTGNEPQWLNTRVPDIFNQHLLDSPAENENGLRWIDTNLSDELSLTLIIIGSLILLLARRQNEDELIMKIRLEALLWAALANAILIILSTWIIYDLAFFKVMMISMPLFYFLFIFRFHWKLWKFKSLPNEE